MLRSHEPQKGAVDSVQPAIPCPPIRTVAGRRDLLEALGGPVAQPEIRRLVDPMALQSQSRVSGYQPIGHEAVGLICVRERGIVTSSVLTYAAA